MESSANRLSALLLALFLIASVMSMVFATPIDHMEDPMLPEVPDDARTLSRCSAEKSSDDVATTPASTKSADVTAPIGSQALCPATLTLRAPPRAPALALHYERMESSQEEVSNKRFADILNRSRAVLTGNNAL